VTIVLAAGLLALEGLLGLGYAVVALGEVRFSRAVVGVGVAMAAFGLLLILVARGVFLVRRWSRGPAVVAQLILLPIAWSFRGGPTTWVSGALAALAIAVLVGVLHPRSTAVFVGQRADKTQP
jgi:uncharacterized membrane protein (DUF2068 family)